MLPRLLATPVVVLSLLPALARAETMSASRRPSKAAAPALAKPKRTAHAPKADAPEGRRPARPCIKPAVEVTTGFESAAFPLTTCSGAAAPLAVDRLSILARPPSTPKPNRSLEALDKKAGPDLAPGIRRVDVGLVERLERVVDHFRKAEPDAHRASGKAAARVLLVSGYRPQSAGSYHQLGRALDFRIDGVTNEALVAFCKTLPDTGCGYYPNSLFVHMDVRNPGAGHITWIDVSRPGEAPHYVSRWPLPPEPEDTKTLPTLPPPDEQLGGAGHAGKRVAHPYFF